MTSLWHCTVRTERDDVIMRQCRGDRLSSRDSQVVSMIKCVLSNGSSLNSVSYVRLQFMAQQCAERERERGRWGRGEREGETATASRSAKGSPLDGAYSLDTRQSVRGASNDGVIDSTQYAIHFMAVQLEATRAAPRREYDAQLSSAELQPAPALYWSI